MSVTEVRYKKTGIEWMPEIPEHWEIVRLKNIVKINFNNLSEQTSKNSSLKYVDITNVNGEGEILEIQELKFKDAPSRARRILKRDDTIISTVRTYLKAITAIKEDNLIGSTGFAVLTPIKEKLNPDYLFYFVSSKFFVNKVMMNSVGVAYPAITPSILGCLPFILPPTEEQEEIVSALNAESAKITHFIQTKQRFIELLKEQRQSIITDAVTKGIDEKVKMKETGIDWMPEMPRHWEQYRLRKILKDGKEGIKIGPFGSSLKLEDLVDKGIRVYGQENVIDDNFTVGKRFLSLTKFKDLSVYEIFPNDILITMMGTTGKCKVVPADVEKGIMDSHLIRIRIKEELYIPELLALIINESYFIKFQLEITSKGSIMSGLNSSIVKNLTLFVPSIEEQKGILKHIKTETKTLDLAISKAEREIDLIKEYREAMIAEAVTGKIKL